MNGIYVLDAIKPKARDSKLSHRLCKISVKRAKKSIPDDDDDDDEGTFHTKAIIGLSAANICKFLINLTDK